MNRRIFLAGAASSSLVLKLRADDAVQDARKWGDLRGRFVYDGEPPEPVRLKINKDAAVLKKPLYEESLLVEGKSQGLANVVVTLLPAEPDELPRNHPSYAAAREQPVETTFQSLAIRPRVTVLRTGQKYLYVNHDPVEHSPRWDLRNNRPPSVLVSGAREVITRGYEQAESAPVSISCSIHPWESAVLVVADHPYIGVSQTDGSFVIKHVPAGTWHFQLWHERCQWIKKLMIAGNEQGLDRGRLRVEIRPGVNDLGEMKIEPKLLERKR